MHLLPYPQEITKKTGAFTLHKHTLFISRSAAQLPAVKHALKKLCADYMLSVEKNDADNFFMSIGNPQSTARSPKKPEAYALNVDQQGVSLHGYDSDGIFWALTTLRQLLNDSGQAPALEIKDFPAYGLRYHHDDISRKQISTLKDFKRIIRHLSQFKIKYYTLYMEDVLFLKSNPDIGKDRGRIMPNEIKAMHAEAKNYNVTIFPTYSLMGHQENLLQHPQYRKYAKEVTQNPSAYDPRKKTLRPYLKKIIADVCESFPDAPYFHACFDEVIGLPTHIIIDHANWCAQEIAKHGKKMMMWIDMFKDHNAIADMKNLDPNILFVEWSYCKPGPCIDEYIKHEYNIIGLAGYSNWCKFLPDVTESQNNINHWAKTMKRLKGPGFGSSMWGDDGYENSRDLSWNLFAYMGEVTWLGKKGPAQFQKRFQSIFYGAPDITLTRVVEEKAPARTINPRVLWNYFRQSTTHLIRLIAHDKKLLAKIQADKKTLQSCLPLIDRAIRHAKRESTQIIHYRVAVKRELLILNRMLLANRIRNGLSGTALKKAVTIALSDTKAVARSYRSAWLQNNKVPNIEVSLAVYDDICADLNALLETVPSKSMYTEISLDSHYNNFTPEVAGIPIGRHVINDVTFNFAPQDVTHCSIAAGKSVSIALDGGTLSDLHIIYGGQIDVGISKNYIRLELFNGHKKVYNEVLKSTDDLCHWWSPLGEHIWGGGGFVLVNKKRNQLALLCQNNRGLMHLSNFPFKKGLTADRLQISNVCTDQPFELLALTTSP